ncbi:amino acid adenylation domain-containing protein [Streptomyces atratus]|uniref:amino acid adenylation domain-containing protein n=1 Tax=Streptomyces atratus TaxID=1893 RepID=UPI0033D15032
MPPPPPTVVTDQARTVPGLVGREAKRTPEATAVVAGGLRMSYEDLDRRSARLARRLRTLGAGPEAPVGVLLGRSPDLVVALLAVWRAGAPYLALDASLPQPRLDVLVADFGTGLVLCDPAARDTVAATGATPVVPAETEGVWAASGKASEPGAAACVLPASGSADAPEDGVVVTHEVFADRVTAAVARLGLTAGDRVLHHADLLSDAHVWEIFAPLCAGAAVVLAPDADRDPAALVRVMGEHRVSVVRAGPSLLRTLAGQAGRPQCTALRAVVSCEGGGWQVHWSVEGSVESAAVSEVPVPVAFAGRAAAAPAAVAVEGDGFALTFGGLDEASNRWARCLRSLGVGHGSVVGVLVRRGPDLHAVMLGVWKAGAAFVPLDPAFPAARTAWLLADAGARVLVTEVAYVPDGFDRCVLCVDDPEVASALARASGAALGVAHDPDEAAYVIHTPGAAGRPYGVAVTHRGLANHAAWAARDLAGAGRGGGAVFSSIACELAVMGMWAPLLAGQRVLMLPQDLDVAELGERLAAAGPFSFLKLTSGQLEFLSKQLGDAGTAALAGVVVVEGEALRGPGAARLAGVLGPGRLVHEYGTAEASAGPCVHPVPADPGAGVVPAGTQLPGAVIRVLDGEYRPVPVGMVGELYVAGAGVARGYPGRGALTAQRFVPDPYGPPGTRMYRTGDLARWTEAGVAELVGRTDRQVRISGHRVDPAESEEALHDHPCVSEAVVVGCEPAPGDVRLAAYVVPRPGAEGLDSAVLAAHCGRRLPGYQVPGSFTLLDEVPLDADGRVDREALPDASVAVLEGDGGWRRFEDTQEGPK